MSDRTDHELLAEFVRNESDEAFATLVARHVNLVYSTALRSTADWTHAQEITQAVFIILARKAARLSPRVVVSGWLYRTVQLTAANFTRGERRRQRREQEAYMQSTLNEPAAAVWEQMTPFLDAAMDSLREPDRNIVVLRFFENKTAQEAARVLNVSEAAAHKRTARALEKLSQFFSKRGITLSTAAIAGAVSANSVQAAPVGLAATAAAAAAKQATIPAALTTLVKGTMKTMTWIKLKFAVGIGAVALLAAGTSTLVLSSENSRESPPSNTSGFQLRLVVDAPSTDSEEMVMVRPNRASGQVVRERLHVSKEVLLDQTAVQSASIATNRDNTRAVDFTLTPEGREQFARITRDNIGRQLAMVADGRLVSAPVIQSEIAGGQGRITGNFTAQEARALVKAISNTSSE